MFLLSDELWATELDFRPQRVMLSNLPRLKLAVADSNGTKCIKSLQVEIHVHEGCV